MRIIILLSFLFFASQSLAQMSLINYINQDEATITAALDDLGYYYELQYDTESDYWDGEQMIMVWIDEYNAYIGNSAWIYLNNDNCYQVQYNFFGDEYVLESIRGVMYKRTDFHECSDLFDCWSQDVEGATTTFYWNLFNQYEGDENWKAVIIEAEEQYQENRYMYEWSKY